MAANKVSKQQLNNALKQLPVPVQDHCKRCKTIAGYIVDKIRTQDWFLDTGQNPSHIISAVFYHDLGKTRLSRDNLYAQHNETTAKKKLYRSHIELGVEVLEQEGEINLAERTARSFEQYLYQAITEHHEQADGCGYPKGLDAASTSLTGKITAIADTLDNLLFVGRTDAAPVEEVLTKLDEMAGRELDAELVRAMLADRGMLLKFLLYMDANNRGKRQQDAYGLQMHVNGIYNIRENRRVDNLIAYVINDPYYGIVRPEVFWPVAEHTAQILRLTKLAVERACITADEIHERHEEFPLLSVPVASTCLENKTFVPDLCKLLTKYELRPGTICLVLDGFTDENDTEIYLDGVMRLREAGYRVAAHGMNAGSTLLSVLDRMHLDAIYVDAQYTARIMTNANAYGVASGLLDLAHNLHTRLVFLGVDVRKVEQELIKLGAFYGSGALYGEAQPEYSFIAKYGGDEA